jgi:hypothetical protein
MLEYKNYAAFDGLREKVEPIAAQVLGGESERRSLVASGPSSARSSVASSAASLSFAIRPLRDALANKDSA